MFTTLHIPITYSKTKIDKYHLCHCLEKNLFVLLTKRLSLVTLTKLVVDKNNTMQWSQLLYIMLTYCIMKKFWLLENYNNLVAIRQWLGSSSRKTLSTSSLLLMFHVSQTSSLLHKKCVGTSPLPHSLCRSYKEVRCFLYLTNYL